MKVSNHFILIFTTIWASQGQYLRHLEHDTSSAIVEEPSQVKLAVTDNDESGNQPPNASASTKALKRKQLKSYFQKRRSQIKVLATTVTDSGQVIDWIDPTSQQLPKGRSFADVVPPDFPSAPKAKSASHSTDVPSDSLFELQRQPHAMGPEGTVPVLRRDNLFDQLEDDQLPNSVEDFLSKYGDKKDVPHKHKFSRDGKKGTTSSHDEANSNVGPYHRHLISEPQYYNHKYVSTEEEVDNFGGEAYLNTWKPYVWKYGEFSLAQVAVSAGSPIQTVECGWQVSSQIYGDSDPHLFIYFTTDGYNSDGDYLGGYNTDVAGFVQYSDTIFPGATITTNTSLSKYGGKQYDMQVKVLLFEDNWWISVFGEVMGYFPASLYDSQSDGLLNGATSINWYGETVDVKDGKTSRTWMGSGRFANKGKRYAAYIRNIQTYRADCNCTENYSPQYTVISNRNCFSYVPKINSPYSWGSYFYYGGPGAYNNPKCTT